MSKEQPVKIEYQTLVVVWAGLLMSQALFFVLIWFIKPELISRDTTRPFLGSQPLIILVFAGSALIFFLLSQVISRQHVQRAIRDRDAGCVQTGLVIGCALSEISGILGVILALIMDYPYFYLWIALGIFGILLNFPRRSSLNAASDRPGAFV
jgi:F0F1-type ATP synthase membrane subunit c/vacuolar-type H+-ATPase subunit K